MEIQKEPLWHSITLLLVALLSPSRVVENARLQAKLRFAKSEGQAPPSPWGA